jgi:hypothetical protein
LTQMDEVTQQNSALVEENAATAKTLEHQAKSMDERVAGFRLRSNAASGGYATAERASAPRAAAPVSRPAAAKRSVAAASKTTANRGPVGKMQASLATALKQEPDWKEF